LSTRTQLATTPTGCTPRRIGPFGLIAMPPVPTAGGSRTGSHGAAAPQARRPGPRGSQPRRPPLKAVGAGRELERLRSRHGEHAEIRGSCRRSGAHGALPGRAGSTGAHRQRVRNRRRGRPGGPPPGRRARRSRHPGDRGTRRDRRLGPAEGRHALADALRTTNFRAFSPGTLREHAQALPTRRSRPF
jgi:hypothetical protein